MGKNNDDQSPGAESFDFAPDNSPKMGGPIDPRYGKTSPDPMRAQRNPACFLAYVLTNGIPDKP